jgi:hypothetical protein
MAFHPTFQCCHDISLGISHGFGLGKASSAVILMRVINANRVADIVPDKDFLYPKWLNLRPRMLLFGQVFEAVPNSN